MYAIGAGGGGGDVNIVALATGLETRLTLSGNGFSPIWSPDGTRVFYADIRPGNEGGIYSRAHDGSSAETLVRSGDEILILNSFSSDGARLLTTAYVPTIHNRVLYLNRDESDNDQPFGTQQGYQWGAMFSPDDRWVAYSSNESGVDEVYVEPAEGEGRWQVSSGGGMGPVWSADGSELSYADYRGIYRVSVESGHGVFRPSQAELLFEGRFSVQTAPVRNFDVAPDGQTFVLVKPVEGDEAGTDLVVRLNWFEHLNGLAPVAR